MTQRIVSAFTPEKVVLFGSYAYGTPQVYSDLDILVVMQSEESIFSRIRRVSEVAAVPFLPMDVIVQTPDEIRDRLSGGDTFFQEILTEFSPPQASSL